MTDYKEAYEAAQAALDRIIAKLDEELAEMEETVNVSV